MPHHSCTVCQHPDVAAIDAALRQGTPPMRELAKRTGLSLTAVFRHKQHAKATKGPTLNNIPEEIRKLKIMLAAAKRKKDTTAALSISREIRAWVMLDAKTQPFSAPGSDADAAEMPLSEALATARVLIEVEVDAGSADTIAWLYALAERARSAAGGK
jgi:hypothetical protein